MKVLVIGSTGRVGMALTMQLLSRNVGVLAIVRSESKLKDMLAATKTPTNNLEVVQAEVTALSVEDFKKHIHDGKCNGVAIALGHRLGMKGLFMEDLFVSKVTRMVFEACELLPIDSAIRYAILSTPGFFDTRQPPADVSYSFMSRTVLKVLQHCLVPVADNQAQAEVFLGAPLSTKVQWCAVRPFNFIEEAECEYETTEDMKEDVFAKGQASIANIGHFMADLLVKDEVWQKWKGKTVVMKNV